VTGLARRPLKNVEAASSSPKRRLYLKIQAGTATERVIFC